MSVTVKHFGPEDVPSWNRLVAKSKNGTFLFDRGYMDYHADRFDDHSLMFYEDATLIGLMAANRDGDSVFSHGGLTYGGVVTDSRMKASRMLSIFEVLVECLRREGVRRLIYKVVPHIYHSLPAEEDLYALFRLGAELYRRDLSSALKPSERMKMSKGRKASISKAYRSGVTVQECRDFGAFMNLERDVLRERHGLAPVHSTQEMELLAERFPKNIRLFTARRGDDLLAGVIVYETPIVAHAQYIGVGLEGREVGAGDLLMHHLVDVVYCDKRFFDFGISTEEDGRFLNPGLAWYKESFGARAVVYDAYELML